MKIFAKRKRTAAPIGTLPVAKERGSFASDPIVEQLLKKDPKEWNSKERRMIKRYEERKSDHLEGNSSAQSIPNESAVVGIENSNQEARRNDNNDENDSHDRSSSSDDDSEELIQKLADGGLPAATAQQGNANVEGAKSGESSNETGILDEKEKSNSGRQVDPEHEVYKLLEKLNSKMKRTLSRKLERQGATVLLEVQDEAKKILGGNTSEQGSKKRDSDALDSQSGTEEKQNKKRRKKEVDLSNLSAEERLRREDQRRKQKEAVERRAREDKTPGYKHPLNSERRRANRRKPKWKNRTPSCSGSTSVKNEHNHSGYHHRKQAV